MQSYVYREILDKSINGVKIYGGIIDYIDGLLTKNLVVPNDPDDDPQGTGSINGTDYKIGDKAYIKSIAAESVVSRLYLSVKNSAGTNDRFLATLSSNNGVMSLYDSSNVETIKLTARSVQFSFLKNKLVVGSISEKNGIYKFEVDDSSWLKTLTGTTLTYTEAIITSAGITNAQIDVLLFGDGGGGYINAANLKGASELSYAEATQLKNINASTIGATAWSHVGSLDQDLGSGDGVEFNSVTVTDLIVNGSFTIDSLTVENDLIAGAIYTDGDINGGNDIGSVRDFLAGRHVIANDMVSAEHFYEKDYPSNVIIGRDEDASTYYDIKIGVGDGSADSDPSVAGAKVIKATYLGYKTELIGSFTYSNNSPHVNVRLKPNDANARPRTSPFNFGFESFCAGSAYIIEGTSVSTRYLLIPMIYNDGIKFVEQNTGNLPQGVTSTVYFHVSFYSNMKP